MDMLVEMRFSLPCGAPSGQRHDHSGQATDLTIAGRRSHAQSVGATKDPEATVEREVLAEPARRVAEHDLAALLNEARDPEPWPPGSDRPGGRLRGGSLPTGSTRLGKLGALLLRLRDGI